MCFYPQTFLEAGENPAFEYVDDISAVQGSTVRLLLGVKPVTFQVLGCHVTQKAGTVFAFECYRAPFHTQMDKSSNRRCSTNQPHFIGSSLFHLKICFWPPVFFKLIQRSAVNHCICWQTGEHDEADAHVDAFSEYITARALIGRRSAHDDRRLEVAVPLSSLYFPPQHCL